MSLAPDFGGMLQRASRQTLHNLSVGQGALGALGNALPLALSNEDRGEATLPSSVALMAAITHLMSKAGQGFPETNGRAERGNRWRRTLREDN